MDLMIIVRIFIFYAISYINYLIILYFLVQNYPKVKCARRECPSPYITDITIPQSPLPKGVNVSTPRGAGASAYISSPDPFALTCPTDKPFASPNDAHRVAYSQLHAYSYHSHGFFFWNFRTELEDKWDYMKVSLKS